MILACIQLGGLGLSTFTVGFSLLVRRKLGIREMKLASESSGGSSLDIAGLLRLIIVFTFACEFIGACLLALRFIPQFGVGASGLPSFAPFPLTATPVSTWWDFTPPAAA